MGPMYGLLRRPVIWLTIPAIALVVLYERAFPSSMFVEGNWAAVAGQSTLFLLFSAGLAAVGGALEGSRVRRSLLFAQPIARRRLVVLVRLLAPALILGVLVQLSAFLMLARQAANSPGTPPAVLLAAQGAAIVFHLALGFTLGRSLPLAAAVPGALLASYSWLGFTGAVSYTPVRYLSGLADTQCCSVDTVVNPAGPQATVVFSLGATAVLLAFGIRYPRRPLRTRVLRLGLTGLALLAVVSGGMWIARDVGYAPVATRPASATRCAGDSPTVCLFPEQAANPAIRPTIARAAHNLDGVGVPVARVVSGSRGTSTSSVAYAYFSPGMSAPQALHSYLSSYFPSDGPRYCGDGSDYGDRLKLEGAMGAWLIAKASRGIAPASAVPPIQQDGQNVAARVLKESSTAQLRWFAQANAAQASCTVKLAELLRS